MKTAVKLSLLAVLAGLLGCNGQSRNGQLPEKGKQLLTVDFKQGQPLRYKFVSSRAMTLSWGTVEGGRGGPRETVDKFSESMDMVVSYMPVEVDPYGLTTIKATCESVKVKRTAPRSGRVPKDAVESLPGKTFTFTVHPSGKIEDYSKLDDLIKQIGEKAFRPRSRQGRIKEPDMIGDFVATQWFLWDPLSSIEKPTKGVAVGETWNSQLSLPSPMVMRKARDVTYTLKEIRPTENGQQAVISSSYALAESVPTGWPVPYTGSFQISGRFGLLRSYQISELQGGGEELFNIDSGRIERYSQRYKMKVAASLLFPLPGANPHVTIDQRLTMQLLGN
ncbi:MAG: hypothetical protein ACYTBJ_08800 [Planctomycetota bacterium]